MVWEEGDGCTVMEGPVSTVTVTVSLTYASGQELHRMRNSYVVVAAGLGVYAEEMLHEVWADPPTYQQYSQFPLMQLPPV